MESFLKSVLEFFGAIYALIVSVIVFVILLMLVAKWMLFRQYDRKLHKKRGIQFALIIHSCRTLHGLIEVK